MTLVIISHTEHYKTDDGTLVGWGPTISEINHLVAHFDTIIHVAMLHDGKAPPSALPYTSERITFVSIPALGGRGIGSKLKSMVYAPKVIRSVAKVLREATVFQLRTPTGIGVYLIPYLTFFNKTKGWYKYAGNWNQTHPPLGYRLQRWMLKHQSRRVTINGRWEGQPKHCLTFENPCLTEAEVALGAAYSASREWPTVWNFCYVGRLESEKGVGRILDAFKVLSADEKAKIGTLHLVGDGPERSQFEAISKEIGVTVVFHGFLPRTEVFAIYKQCHGFIMPTTASEGFPKVIAEAMNFGCIPLVSNISAIGHYIHAKNGFLISPVNTNTIVKTILALVEIDESEYDSLIKNSSSIVEMFTFEYYNKRILKVIKS
ncbi:glycosyltransferase [Flavobacteriaceae bacterium 144Ye]|nr:glycosyltransferase [Flavobacteriaceae bacterium 144Ye]